MNKKRSSLLILAMLCITLLTSVGILPISAQDSVSDRNHAKYQEVREAIDSEMAAYNALDTSDGNSIARGTNSVIILYARQALDIFSSPAMETDDMTEHFELLLAKARLAGKISWIANLHTNASPNESILAEHSELRAKLDAKTSVSDLLSGSDFSDTVCVEMNRTVFREMIREAAREDDSENTSHILHSGVLKIEMCSSPDINGAEYLEVYNEIINLVTLQRARDGAADELKKIYTTVNGSDVGFFEDPFVKIFFATVDGSQYVDEKLTVKDINDALVTAASEILDAVIPSGSRHVIAYRETLKNSFRNDSLEATDKGVFAPISKNLTNYKTDLYRAQTKDKVASIISASETNTDLLGLISEYTDGGGILDGCASAAEMDIEYKRAEVRVSWYREYASCRQAIEDLLYLAAKDISDELTSYARVSIYLVTDSEIINANITQNGADSTLLAMLKKGRLALEDLLCDAKAKRFCIDHKAILEDTSIGENDRTLLEKAMSEYDLLLKNDDLTAEKLKPQKRALNDKYKALITLLINSNASGDDAHAIIAALNTLSSDIAPFALKAQADDCLLRAEALGILQKKYASVTDASDFYNSYDNDSKTALATDYKSAANKIINSIADETSLSQVLAKINAEAELSIEKHDAIARVRLAARGYTLSEVAKTVEEAEKAINAQTDIQKMILLRDTAIFKVECQIKSEEMRAEINSLKAAIDGLRALDSASKTVLKGEADILFSICNQAASASDKTALDGIVADFNNKLSVLRTKAEAASLSEGKRQFIDEIKKSIASAKETVNGCSFINYTVQNTSEEFILKLEALEKSFEKNVNDTSTGWSELDQLKALAIEDIEKTVIDAYSAECKGARASARNSIAAAFTMPERYSNENREKIEKMISDCNTALDEAATVERILALRDAAISNIAKVYTLLDEAKEAAIKKVDDLYFLLKKDKDCYSANTWTEIEELYGHTAAEIKQISAFEDKDRAADIADERCALMIAKRKDKLNTQAGTVISSSNTYPNSFDILANGYAATLTLKGQIPYDAYFSVFPLSNENAVKLIRKAVKNGNVFLSNGLEANKALLKSLRGCNVLVGLDMEYSAAMTAINGTYSISLLLPDTLDTENILGVMYIRSGGEVEYFECSLNEKTLSFDIPHFSSFYIVTEKTVDLLPLIVTLSIILLLEIAVIALLLIRRKKAKAQTSLASFIPLPAISALAKITPAGAVPVSIVLSALILCAGAFAAWLISDEARQRLKKQKKENSVKALPNPAPVHAIKSAKNSGSERSRIAAPKEEQQEEQENTKKSAQKSVSESIPSEALSEPLQDSEALLVLDTVTVEEANGLMSDSDAKASLKEMPYESVSYATYSMCGKKHEINIDVISSAFSAGETVSLDALKEKGLLPRNAKAVKILARGTLDKPLTVIAQDFSTAAIKMITLTGGHAMLIERK